MALFMLFHKKMSKSFAFSLKISIFATDIDINQPINLRHPLTHALQSAKQPFLDRYLAPRPFAAPFPISLRQIFPIVRRLFQMVSRSSVSDISPQWRLE